MAALSAKQKHLLKKFVLDLEKHKARHTELISVYIPAGYELNKIINHLSQEQGTASNIKSASTRKNVQDALERMIQHLKMVGRTPANGLAVFSGNVAEREGQQDFKVWSLEPPAPLKTRIYRCDKQFVTDLLRGQMEVKDVYGLVVIDRREADIALLKGKTIVPLTRSTSNVPGKSRAGGQSAARFERLREGAAKEFFVRVGGHMKDEFLDKKDLKGIIVGGPGPTKNDFIDGNFITNEVKKKIIAVKDVTYTGMFGLEELLDKSQDVLAKEEIANEKKLMGRFFDLLARQRDKVSYGRDHVMKVLKMGAVETLLLSESLDDKTIDEFEEEAKIVGTAVEIISIETREGVQLKDLGRVAAILRYAVAQE